MTAQSDLAFIDRLANALEKLANAQAAVATRTAFDGNWNVKNFIQHYLEVAAANYWLYTAALLHICETIQATLPTRKFIKHFDQGMQSQGGKRGHG